MSIKINNNNTVITFNNNYNSDSREQNGYHAVQNITSDS